MEAQLEGQGDQKPINLIPVKKAASSVPPIIHHLESCLPANIIPLCIGLHIWSPPLRVSVNIWSATLAQLGRDPTKCLENCGMISSKLALMLSSGLVKT
ncbi:hypothetical protein BgiMline_002050 [Biomphalaria glabrata]|nr:hypothetical protein BgiMline_001927 [Biomphalaria glabrata]KAI8774613.1 hypothetical protein BgiBS90_024435 [Biomphalaria glabrata]